MVAFHVPDWQCSLVYQIYPPGYSVRKIPRLMPKRLAKSAIKYAPFGESIVADRLGKKTMHKDPDFLVVPIFPVTSAIRRTCTPLMWPRSCTPNSKPFHDRACPLTLTRARASRGSIAQSRLMTSYSVSASASRAKWASNAEF